MNRKYSKKKQKISGLLIIGGVLVLAALVLALKPKTGSSEGDLALEARLDAALDENRPTFVFLHSLDCIPCEQMMEIVAQVYPDFKDRITLIDVDVYDQRNANILKREGLQAIPTLVFYDRKGERYIHVGVLPADQLRVVFQNLSGE